MSKAQNILPNEKKASQKAMIKEVAAKVKNRVLFPEKVAYAKKLLRLINETEAKAKNLPESVKYYV